MTPQRLQSILASFPARAGDAAWVYSQAPSRTLLPLGRAELHLARLYAAAAPLLAALHGCDERLEAALTGAAHERRVQRLRAWLAAATEGGAFGKMQRWPIVAAKQRVRASLPKRRAAT